MGRKSREKRERRLQWANEAPPSPNSFITFLDKIGFWTEKNINPYIFGIVAFSLLVIFLTIVLTTMLFDNYSPSGRFSSLRVEASEFIYKAPVKRGHSSSYRLSDGRGQLNRSHISKDEYKNFVAALKECEPLLLRLNGDEIFSVRRATNHTTIIDQENYFALKKMNTIGLSIFLILLKCLFLFFIHKIWRLYNKSKSKRNKLKQSHRHSPPLHC